jgi:hypothetical protein
VLASVYFLLILVSSIITGAVNSFSEGGGSGGYFLNQY